MTKRLVRAAALIGLMIFGLCACTTEGNPVSGPTTSTQQNRAQEKQAALQIKGLVEDIKEIKITQAPTTVGLGVGKAFAADVTQQDGTVWNSVGNLGDSESFGGPPWVILGSTETPVTVTYIDGTKEVLP
jgi:hypothetical protein